MVILRRNDSARLRYHVRVQRAPCSIAAQRSVELVPPLKRHHQFQTYTTQTWSHEKDAYELDVFSTIY